jgi:large subunit ribosomal protein L17
MRHRKTGLKLSRTSSHRDAMFRNMVTSLFKHDRIRTTDAKAKELRRWADHLITLAKKGDLHARRQALAIVREKQIVHKLFDEASERYAGLSGGYTRVVKLGTRPGDAAPVSLVELVTKESVSGKTKKKPAKAKATPKKETVAEAAAKKDKATPAAEPEPAEEAPAVEEPEPQANEESVAAAEKTESEGPSEQPEAEAATDVTVEADEIQADETEAVEAEPEKPKKKTAKKASKKDEDES